MFFWLEMIEADTSTSLSVNHPMCDVFISKMILRKMTLDCSDLEYVDNYKYLGVWLDCKISFQTHISRLQSKVKSRIGFLFSNKASFTHAAKHTLVKLTILPILDFGDVIYKIVSNTLLSKCDAVYHSVDPNCTVLSHMFSFRLVLYRMVQL